MFWLSALTLIGSAPTALTAPVEGGQRIVVDKAPPVDAVEPIPEAFLSYSIEFAFFPDFAGNLSRPNEFSNNLLDNLALLQGTKPYIRVGGNTQDKTFYQHDLETGIDSVYNSAVSKDYPARSRIGPSFFESYHTFPNAKYIHGFNWGHAGNSTEGWENVLESAKAACQGIGSDRLWSWEYGNEADTYGEWWAYRDNATWTEEALAAEWLDHIPKIKAEMAKVCPELADSDRYGFIVPSYTPIEYLDPVLTWQAGLDKSPDVKAFCQHNYIGISTDPGLTLQTTLMNHSNTVDKMARYKKDLKAINAPREGYILGETNSLALQGKPGISDAFGAALWNLDFALHCASLGIRRIHMHQGSNYRYASWQPVTTNRTPTGTKPAYYGNIATAAFLGNLTAEPVQISGLQMPNYELDVGYAAYVGKQLKRIALINMRTYNYTADGNFSSTALNDQARPEQTYRFQIPVEDKHKFSRVTVDRLIANGSDALSGATFAGVSYNYELNEGRPVRLENVTAGETVRIGRDGLLEVRVPDASAAILNLE